MSLQVIILVDNFVDRGEGLLAEHGLSLLVEGEDGKVLLDAGQTGVCVRNAARLGVGLDYLDRVVVSHGHYDHGGGLPALLDACVRPEVLAHPHAFSPRYAGRPGQEERPIGLSYKVEDLTRRGARVRLETRALEISRAFLATGPIPRLIEFEDDAPDFWVKGDHGWLPDHFEDDQALVVRTKEGLVVLLGCAHAGVINTLRHAMKLTGDDRIRAVIGGLHLASASLGRIHRTMAALREMEVGQVVACHCTGFAARMHLHATLGERFVNGAVGLRLTF